MGCKTSCAAEKAAWQSNVTMLQAYRQEMIGLLKRERPGEASDLVNPRTLRGAFANLAVTYYDFPTWLFRFDDKVARGWAIDINSYRYERNAYVEDVYNLLTGLLETSSGSALRNQIAAAGHDLRILPHFDFSHYAVPPHYALGLSTSARPGNDPVSTLTDVASTINFSPSKWGRDGKPGSLGFRGPGSDADEVLFHELVHGLRSRTGVDIPKSDLDDDCASDEEFVAIVITNIYLAEKGETALRGSNDAFSAMRRPRDFLGNAQHVRLLRAFRESQPELFAALADIPESKAWWNPVRELRDAGE